LPRPTYFADYRRRRQIRKSTVLLLILFLLLFIPFVAGYSTEDTVRFYSDLTTGVVSQTVREAPPEGDIHKGILPTVEDPLRVGIGDIHKDLDAYVAKTVTTKGKMGFSIPLAYDPVWEQMARTMQGICFLESADGYSIFIAKPLPSPCPNLDHIGSVYEVTGEVVLIDGKLAIRCSSIELIPKEHF